jgi:8-oxo-dGTP pyrophosphatase MutT (NUDIX family)
VPATITIRHAARVLLIDSRDRLLLFRCRDPRIETPVLWITPGGGLREGETHAEAAARELLEETGIAGIPIGACVWTRSHTFAFGERMLDQREQFFLVRCGAAPAIDRSRHCADEILILEDHHWWTADEIIEAEGETFTPRQLGQFFKRLLQNGSPDAPIDVGI